MAKLKNALDSAGSQLGTATMGLLSGDVDGNGPFTKVDASVVKAQIPRQASPLNRRS